MCHYQDMKTKNSSKPQKKGELIKIGKTWYGIAGDDGAYIIYRLYRVEWRFIARAETYSGAVAKVIDNISLSRIPGANLAAHGVFRG